ncbi:hypothetical protein ABEG10_36030 [Burkholderia cenocepacia]|uniref:hypothetical protein n=1 Tax=Burkholderia cenocepacia TaxID=95486 RepID=UPI000AB8564F|nr:hypothetical protein [Burkholderia cenocepacia]MCO8322287.1 hypothetical protein [Burkholderia cenocepacia]MCO8329571.1 hypothetical protein [Burkholderia cenocepacia]MCO8336857.1 hypothetical protein [Burkholderia cenocepacia]MCO8344142.1 hypothetical protein [Burkholderia cenocepacia]MCO8357424.1 hypothetical protein [Burkholderia cenocepacia]
MGVATLSGSVTGGTLGATSGAVAAGIGGAAGALASQGVMIAGGEQHGLNFASITLVLYRQASLRALVPRQVRRVARGVQRLKVP